MKLLLDIPDNKAASFLEVLKSISFVKAQPLTEPRAKLLTEIRDAVVEIKQIKSGNKKARSADEFLSGL